jgi:N-acetylglucosaminylphosphatidylinositol deacetylase
MNGHGRAHDGLEASSVLLVTAHPDDESMFFAPTLAHVLQRGAEVHILCLSTGACE